MGPEGEPDFFYPRGLVLERDWLYVVDANTVTRMRSEAAKVRQAPSWPSSWANVSLLFGPRSPFSHRSTWANLHLLGQPDTSR